MLLFEIPARLWTLATKVEDLLSLQTKMHASLEGVEARLRAIEDKMIRFEAEQGQLITTAQAAANLAAVSVASASISDIVTRLTKVEIHQSHLQTRLSPPSS